MRRKRMEVLYPKAAVCSKSWARETPVVAIADI
jgi:hypothetical protein